MSAKPEITTYLCTLLICFFWRPRGLQDRGLSEVWKTFPKPTSITGYNAVCWSLVTLGRELRVKRCSWSQLHKHPPLLLVPQPCWSTTILHHPPNHGLQEANQPGLLSRTPRDEISSLPAPLQPFPDLPLGPGVVPSSEPVPSPCTHPPGSASLYMVPFNASFALL